MAQQPIRVIVVTDGDGVARRTLEQAAARLGLRVISRTAGNPTVLSGPEVLDLIKSAPHDPVLVMADDRGFPGTGPGELMMEYLAGCPEVQLIGALAVASHTPGASGVFVRASVTRAGELVPVAVDKNGFPEPDRRLVGDTVDLLQRLQLPYVVGIGDLGKQGGADAGAELTCRALSLIVEHAGRPGEPWGCGDIT